MKKTLNDKSLKTGQKVKIITIVPKSWSRTKVASEYVVRESQKVKNSKGILEFLDEKRTWKLNERVRQDDHLFYDDDEYYCMMPGKKDYVSLAKKVHKQKLLLLCNLNELYTAFKEKYPN